MTVAFPLPHGGAGPSGGAEPVPAGAPPGVAVVAAQPWSGFAEAADAVLALLQDRLGMDLWAVTRVRDDHQEVLVARSAGFPIPAGAVLPWAESFCVRMVAGAPRVAPRVRAEPAYATAGLGERYRIGAYVGVPLVDEDGGLFGTLCALSVDEQPAALSAELPLVELLARQLSTLLAKERLAADRSAAAAAAYALAERDAVTGLLNERGWDRALEAEEARCARTGASSAVAVVAVGSGREAEAADLLGGLARAADVLASPGAGALAVLAPDTGTASATRWGWRLAGVLASAGLPAAVGTASREDSGSLALAWRDAQEDADRGGGGRTTARGERRG